MQIEKGFHNFHLYRSFLSHLRGAMGHHNVGHMQESMNVGSSIQITTSIEFTGCLLDVLVNTSNVFCEAFVSGGLAQFVHYCCTRQGESMRTVHHTTLFECLSSVCCHGRVGTLNDALASQVGQLVHDGRGHNIHVATGEAKITRNVKDVFRIIELSRGGGNDVSTQQCTAFFLDLVDGSQLAGRNAIRFIDIATRVGKGNWDSPKLNEFFGQRTSQFPATNNHTAFSFQGVILVFEHFIRKVRDAVPWSL